MIKKGKSLILGPHPTSSIHSTWIFSGEMSKRRLSPAPLPPSKRMRTLDPLKPSKSRLTFDTAFYDEIILSIFSHLSAADLCSAQATNKNWSRLAVDNELWKALYIKSYGRSRLRGARGFIGRLDGKEVKPLPGQAKVDDIKDWKWMYRISSNWKTGRCTVEHLSEVVETHPVSSVSDLDYPDQTHILLAGSLTVSASSRPSHSPAIHLRSPSCSEYKLLCTSTRHQIPSQVTTLTMDQSPPTSGNNFRLVSFLSTGEFTIFDVSHTSPSTSSRKLAYCPTRRSARTSPIIQAAYHHPLLITLSHAFYLSIYDLSSDTITHTQTLTSFTSFPPTSLVLSVFSPTTYKLVLAYSIPVYPDHWSVGATELIISGINATSQSPLPPSLSFSPDFSSSSVKSMNVIATRTTRALDVPQGWIDEHKLRAMREQWSRKVSRVAATQTDGKWVVLAPAGTPIPGPSSPASPSPSESTSNSGHSSPFGQSPSYSSSNLYSPTSLQLYRLSLPSPSPWSTLSSSPHPKLSFVRNLQGQMGPISALALADGRCVSLGQNGGIWVWDLERGTGAEVASSDSASVASDSDLGDSHRANGTVIFDERRIVTAGTAGVVVRRFDI